MFKEINDIVYAFVNKKILPWFFQVIIKKKLLNIFSGILNFEIKKQSKELTNQTCTEIQ